MQPRQDLSYIALSMKPLPVVITGKRGNAVLVSEEDWNAISETLYLLSVPGMRESIEEELKQDLSESSKELDW